MACFRVTHRHFFEDTEETDESGYISRYGDWLRAGQLDERDSIPGGCWEFLSLTPRPDRLWSPTHPPIQWIKNACSYTSTPQTRLHGMVLS
jgi:hypothetical protein